MTTRRIALLLLATTLAACAGVPRAPGLDLVRSELYFGRARADGTMVSEGEWQAFLAGHITPRFPYGLTVLDGVGQYRDRAGHVRREDTKVVLIIHAPSADRWVAIEEIRASYRRLFEQDSVLLVTVPARASF
ncbi:MAG TPA: DUF3574 domain-containing protein [Methylomirabilota bacterium]|nr:DUF3574 domain-containing protein [Methylomirabilota bacterium]